jgi:glycosyltransferase involved in cell wall biosynthesis
MILVSVIIPTYNSERYIVQTLDSVFFQSYKNLEVVVVDDGSTDKTLSLLSAVTDPRLKVISQSNSGACVARNLGFKNSKGEFIQFLDADDILSLNKIEVQLKALEGKHNCVANGMWGRFYQSIQEPIKWMPHPNIHMDLEPEEWIFRNHMSQTACWLCPRKLIESAGLWREDLLINQDGEFFSRVILQSQEVLFTPEAKVYYRSNVPGSISSAIQQPEAIRSRFKTIKLLEELLANTQNGVRRNKLMADLYQDFIYSYYPKEQDLIREAKVKVAYYGGSSKPVPGGKFYKILSKFFGWKNVSWLKYKLGRL